MSVGGKTVVKVVLGLLAFYPSAFYTNHNWQGYYWWGFCKGLMQVYNWLYNVGVYIVRESLWNTTLQLSPYLNDSYWQQ